MSYWLTDPELFLYAKGTGSYGVHLWRCKKPVSSSSSSLVVPMKPEDFDFVSNVKNHMELIGDMLDWDETDYRRLVQYIFERRLLVNSQGYVFVELHKGDKDGNKMMNDANKEVPTIYIRSLDVLPLKHYIPKLMERPIPLRTVKYLGDVNGKPALMEEDSKVTKLTARVDNIEAENTRLEAKNNTLDTNVTKLTAGLATTTDNVADLKFMNKTLDTSVTKLTAGLATTADNVADLKSKNKTLEVQVTNLTADLATQKKDLMSKNKTLEIQVTNLTSDLATQKNALATLQRELKRVLENIANPKVVWMNDLKNDTEWVGIEGLGHWTTNHDNMVFLGQQGTFTVDERSTNVRARYWYKVKIWDCKHFYKAVCVEDLTPYKDKARFSEGKWATCKVRGNIYICMRL